jgi:hypothetical protein
VRCERGCLRASLQTLAKDSDNDSGFSGTTLKPRDTSVNTAKGRTRVHGLADLISVYGTLRPKAIPDEEVVCTDTAPTRSYIPVKRGRVRKSDVARESRTGVPDSAAERVQDCGCIVSCGLHGCGREHSDIGRPMLAMGTRRDLAIILVAASSSGLAEMLKRDKSTEMRSSSSRCACSRETT